MANMISTLFKTGTNILGKALSAPGRGIWNSIKVAKTDMDLGKSISDATQGSLNLLKAGWKSTSGGKVINATTRAGSSLGKFASRNPISKALTSSKMLAPAIGMGLIVGGAHGAASAVSQRMSDRQQMTARGMDPNNLGTDGLTLALSKRRHR